MLILFILVINKYKFYNYDNKCVYNNQFFLAFHKCVNDLYCAGYTVQAYMAKHSKVKSIFRFRCITYYMNLCITLMLAQLKDCNGDGVIDCDDYVRLHRLGSAGCNNSLSSDYENKYKLCLQTFERK